MRVEVINTQLSNKFIQEWEEFVLTHPDGSIFQTPEMYVIHLNTSKYSPFVVVCSNEANQILGLMLVVIHKEYKGILGFLSSRALITGGPLVLDNNTIVLNLILEKYNELISNKIIYTQFRNLFGFDFGKNVFEENDFRYLAHLNIINDLSIGREKIWQNFSRSRKRGIIKAENEGFHFIQSDDIDMLNDFYHLLSISYQKIKLPYPSFEFFYNIYNNFKPKNFKLFFLRHGDEYVVSMFALMFKNTVYGYYMGSSTDSELLKKKPIDLFFWEFLKWAVNNGFQYYNWMGAGKPDTPYGVRDFKLQYGGKLVEYGRFEEIHWPLTYKVIKTFYKLWAKIKFR